MSFLESAIPLAERGFRVFPLIPKTKRPFKMSADYDHFDAATTDPEQIQQWGEEVPNANVGLSPDEIFCFLETDDETALKEACSDLPPEVWETTRVSARDNRCYYIFRQTMRTKRAGNMTATREGQDNLFEFKQHRVYCTGPGSIHPKTGTPYKAEWRTIQAMPDVLLNRLCELYGTPKPGNVGVMSEDVKRETTLLERFLATYDVATTGDWFNKGKQWYRPIECPWSDQHENSNEGTSTCIVHTEGGGYGFDCKHRCSSKGWKEFRAELERRFPDRKFSFRGDPGPRLILSGNREPKTSSLYPIEAWDDTVVAEYAKLCADDNNVPLALYAEAFRAALGAVLGDRLVCPDVDGANPRTYTVLIAPFGKGKGTAVDRAVDFFSATWASKSLSCTPGFLSGSPLFTWKPHGLGAWKASANSVPGMARLLREPKNIGMKPHMAWRDTLPRIFSVHEEMKSLLSALFIEGGTGSGLGGVICQLWDRPSFFGGATGNRDAQYGEMLFSMLCGVTPDDWDDLLSHGDVVGGGLFSRLNIVSTDGNYANVGTMKPPDFTVLRESFLPRIAQLQDAPVHVHASDAARSIIEEWTRTLPDGSQRMNIHAWRTALLLAWLRRESEITARTAEDSVALGRYQIDQHALFKPQQADNALARVQNNIVAVLKRKGPLGRGRLQDFTHAQRAGTDLWSRALDGLLREGLVGKGEDGRLLIV